MVTGKPPRRSKSTGEPVTIDLEAENISPVDAANEADKTAASEDTTSASAEPASPEPQDTEPRLADAQTDAPIDEPAPETVQHETHEPMQPPRRSNSGLIAAGIFGGLVALAGMGALQYAGFLPLVIERNAPAPTHTSGLQAEIDALRQQIASLPSPAPAPAAPAPDTALIGRIDALEAAARTAEANAGDAQAIATLDEKVATLTAGLDQLKASVATTAETDARTAAEITQRLDDAEKKLNEPRRDIELARAVALASLKAAIDRGSPFLAELDTLSGVSPDDPAIAGLKPFAAAGVPSRATLMRQFPPTASAILAATHQPDPDEGIAGRLMNSAMSLVKVRPVGNVEGEGPDAVVARIEDKLKNGDFKGAALEWPTLPEAGKTAAAGFKTELDNRLKVEDLVDAAMNNNQAATGNGG